MNFGGALAGAEGGDVRREGREKTKRNSKQKQETGEDVTEREAGLWREEESRQKQEMEDDVTERESRTRAGERKKKQEMKGDVIDREENKVTACVQM